MNNFLNINYLPHLLFKLKQISNELYPMVYSISVKKRIIDQLMQKFFILFEKFNYNYYFEK
tara:strand:+ start:940 stop:1122 length:183 start_codon:yes stop_codon:yes gene_type:complete